MTSWFRSWHGAPTDNSYLAIAKRVGVAPGIVSAVVWALIDYASQNEDRGSVEGFDSESYAAFSGFEETQVVDVINALKDKEKIKENRFVSWERRQPKREDDGAAERKAKQRGKECHAMSRNVTHTDTEQIQITDTEQKEPPLSPPKGGRGEALKKFMERQYPDNSEECPQEWGEAAMDAARGFRPSTKADFAKQINWHFEKFRDHWYSSTRANSRKSDWRRAWLNWWKSEFEKIAKQEERDEFYTKVRN